ncbi:MAG: DUF4012 domain-containing protein [Candidatus Magasanikbacteria bacterium]|nr:DUF4012 domain-containing protein [Candidatus Magasanikbacteria bacterium]
MNSQIKKPSILPLAIFAFAAVMIVVGIFVYNWLTNLTVEEIINSNFVSEIVRDNLNEDGEELFNLLPTFLGYSKPYTYLVLFKNNTELRPGGGFIGSYAVLMADKGEVELIVVEGTENLDGRAPESWDRKPPEPISKYLGLDTWYFRDSNWSPDYMVNARRALEFYKGEGGELANEIDAVVAITPTVLEEMLRLTGPIEVEGIEFTSENVTETLEYEVEYGFLEKEITPKDRKKIMKPLMLTILNKMKSDLFYNYKTYIETFGGLADQRHIMVYSTDKDIENIINKHDWSGEQKTVAGDYLMWVDANMAALKTDHAMERTLMYEIEKNEEGEYIANATMRYENTGSFDWRTTRYRTYARIFVPQGSELVDVEGSMAGDKTEEEGEVDQGQELGKQWFGTFISIEPGDTKTLSFTYKLPEKIEGQIKNGSYTIYVQKQSGTIGHDLVLDLKFEKTIKNAEPEVALAKMQSGVYTIKSDLILDRLFRMEFE